jgi:transcription antitermination factor NusG
MRHDIIQNHVLAQAKISNEWIIGYTYPNAEKKVHRRLENMGVSSFLPLQKVIRNWCDRKKKLEIPLFPGYIFIYTSLYERYNLLNIEGLIRYVAFEGKPATISTGVIDSLKKMLMSEVEVSTENFLAGMHVKINEGPFMGAEGILVRRNGKARFVIQIQALERAVSIDLPAGSVIPI